MSVHTAPSLILVLKATQPAHSIMAWLMHYESHVKRLHPQGAKSKSRLQVILDWVAPCRSPVWQASAASRDSLAVGEDSDFWSSLFVFSGTSRQGTLKMIHEAVIPAAGRIWWRCMVEILES